MRSLLGELDQMSRPFGEERLAMQSELSRTVGELGPALPGRAVARRGIDQEDDGISQW
jgi:hypothetical protein